MTLAPALTGPKKRHAARLLRIRLAAFVHAHRRMNVALQIHLNDLERWGKTGKR